MPHTDGELADAIAHNEFRLVYQPLVAAGSRVVHGAEALVRWHHPARGHLGPSAFLPAIERHHLMGRLTDWTIEEGLRTTSRWLESGFAVPISVNLSATVLHEPDLVDRVMAAVERQGVPTAMLTLEVTETALAKESDAAAEVFRRLRNMGVHVSLDDFGTGYTSLAMLKDYTFDEVKIDRSFVAAMRHSPADAAIVRSILDLGHRLGSQVVAEGIEDGETARLLEDLGCDVLQGFYFAGPCPSDDALAYVRARATGVDDERQRQAAAPRGLRDPAAQAATASHTVMETPAGTYATSATGTLGGIAAVASELCGAAAGVVAVADRTGRWQSVASPACSAKVATCLTRWAHDIREPGSVVEVEDLGTDPVRVGDLQASGGPDLRFFAATPLVADDGAILGALCVADPVARAMSTGQRQGLRTLAKTAANYLQLTRSKTVMRRIHDLTTLLVRMSAPHEIPDAASAVAVASREIVQADGSAIFLAEADGSVRYRAVGIATRSSEDAEMLGRMVIDSRSASPGAGVVRRGTRRFIPVAATAAELPRDLTDALNIASVLYLPLMEGPQVFGIQVLWWSHHQDSLPRQSIIAANILADEASSSLSRLRALAALRAAAQTDTLTGLLNRSSFTAELKRLPPHSAVIMIDLDHFRRLNDTQSHHVGDQTLKSFAAHLRAAAHTTDLVCRWGGEEFVVAHRGHASEGGPQALLHRLRSSWAGSDTTFSSGYALLADGEPPLAAIERAELACRVAKGRGRDCDVLADHPTTLARESR